jgi:sulfite reductase alpha subunit-like flavoprotein
MHTPLILIGPGTGVAPMRALIQQHCLQTSAVDSASAASAGAIPSVLLFFGCRKEQRDFLYGSEWAALNNDRNPFIERADGGEDGLLQHCGGVRVVSAFSQDQLVKHYVTHRIAEHVQTVCAMLLQVYFTPLHYNLILPKY